MKVEQDQTEPTARQCHNGKRIFNLELVAWLVNSIKFLMISQSI